MNKFLITLIISAISFSTSAHTLTHSTLTATYEVPVQDVALKPFSNFEVKRISMKKVNDDVMIQLELPAELTGRDTHYAYDGQIGSNCQRVEKTTSCYIIYPYLEFNQKNAEKILAEKFQGEELINRMKVQKIFSTDPIGIIHVTEQ